MSQRAIDFVQKTFYPDNHSPEGVDRTPDNRPILSWEQLERFGDITRFIQFQVAFADEAKTNGCTVEQWTKTCYNNRQASFIVWAGSDKYISALYNMYHTFQPK